MENNGPAHLWRSDVRDRNWLRVTVTGTNGNRDAFGTHIWVHAGGQVQERRIRSGGSYLSQNEIVAAFGMLDIEVVDSMLVSWPDGRTQTLYDLPVNIEAHIVQGQEGWSTRPMPARVN